MLESCAFCSNNRAVNHIHTSVVTITKDEDRSRQLVERSICSMYACLGDTDKDADLFLFQLDASTTTVVTRTLLRQIETRTTERERENQS